MKKVIISVISTLLVLAFMVQMGWLQVIGINRFSFEKSDNTQDKLDFECASENNINYSFRTQGDYFYHYEDNEWKKIFITGVNIGATEPGLFPGDLTISYDTYLRWFKYIKEMDANVIRVYTALSPDFYRALYDYNIDNDDPLYLIQGVWMDEEDIETYGDVYAENEKIKTEFTKDALNMVDIIHGNITLPERSGYAAGTYTADVSRWLAGWLIGIEWDPKLVENTNVSNPDNINYDGDYLYTQGASTFEAFLCEVGDKVIERETKEYKWQAPVAFSNWVTTDPLTHEDEPHPDEDSVTVNFENVKYKNTFLSKMYLSYHIYPYYPDSLNYQRDYLAYRDDSGKVNTYEAYLKDLKSVHSMPILVAEFGVPTSRGMGHESVMGYNQGQIDETKQGDILIDLFDSIYKCNYAGGLVFTWQDEWFKRTWNNVNFDIADERPFWSNPQTTEQCFGLMTFDPGTDNCISYVDGDVSEWGSDTPIVENGLGKLYMKSDEKYVYFMVDTSDYNFNSDTLYIPIDIKNNQGNDSYADAGITFDKQADFVISINGKDNSRIVCDQYYDAFTYQYGVQYGMIDVPDDLQQKNTGKFIPMNMCYGYELEIPTTKEKVGFKSFETGKLTYGNANPTSDDYQSLADFIYKDGKLEIKIPWQLLNVMDPSSKKIMDDFYTAQSITPTDLNGITVGLGKSGNIELTGNYDYQAWTTPTFHERLKPAYYVLQKNLKKYND